MSPLWRSNKVKQLQTSQKRPSPKHNNDYLNFAQSLFFSRHRQIPQFKFNRNSIKGISLFTSLSRQVAGSMTVEAAIVLPLFLFFFLNLGCAIEMIRLHGNLEFALCDIGRRMAVYGYVLDQGEQEEAEEANMLWKEFKDIAFTYTFVKNEIVNYVGEQYLEESPVSGGANGLQFWESEIFDGNDNFEIIVTYNVSPFSDVIGFGAFRMANKYYGRVWNGYEIPKTEGNENQPEVVYVTENGVVYHENENCSHLFLSVREVSMQEAYESRNEYGSKYTLCERCRDGGAGRLVYITDAGDNIHYQKDCAGLKRTVNVMPKEEAGKYRACSRCAQN